MNEKSTVVRADGYVPDRTGSLNLFFCFRWILIAFKREFKFGDVIRLWEVGHRFLIIQFLMTDRGLGALDQLLLRAFRPVHRPSRAAEPPRRLVAILGRV